MKYFKPRDILSCLKEDYEGRANLGSILPKEMGRVIPVGRLDYRAEGLMLLTNNGDMAKTIHLAAAEYEGVYKC